MPSEVGLRLLLSPLGSNIVVRTACCSVGIVLPVYSTFKAIESRDEIEQKRMLLYWAAYGSFSIAEVFTDKLISWFPLLSHEVCISCLASASNYRSHLQGAKQLYTNHLRPFLRRHQARLDQIVGFVHSETEKIISAHQAEFQFARALVRKVLVSVKEMVKDTSQPVQSQQMRAIEGPSLSAETSERSESGDDDDHEE